MSRVFIQRDQRLILLVNVVALSLFTILFAARQNIEFLLYVGVIVFFLILIVLTNRRVSYPTDLLWGLTFWALLHMSGGGIFFGGNRLYTITLVPISDTYSIFRYDQFVHIVGFGVATLLIYHLVKPSLRDDVRRWTSLSIVIVMAGLGVGALNEIVEFAATVIVPKTGVGGYVNTSLDLVSDLIGAIIALVIIRRREPDRASH